MITANEARALMDLKDKQESIEILHNIADSIRNAAASGYNTLALDLTLNKITSNISTEFEKHGFVMIQEKEMLYITW